jgi:hypothetical protein
MLGVPELGVPELASYENIGARDAAFPKTFAYFCFVAVDGSAVDMVVLYALRAISTARSTSLGFACYVPKSTAGICAPVLSVRWVGMGIVLSCDATGAIQWQ